MGERLTLVQVGRKFLLEGNKVAQTRIPLSLECCHTEVSHALSHPWHNFEDYSLTPIQKVPSSARVLI